MDSSRLHTIVLMAMLGAILVLLVVHADAASVKPSFNMLKPADWETRTGGTRITAGLPDCATGINIRRRSSKDKGKGNQKPWCNRDDDGAWECKNDDAKEAGLAADASSFFSPSFNNFDSDGTAKNFRTIADQIAEKKDASCPITSNIEGEVLTAKYVGAVVESDPTEYWEAPMDFMRVVLDAPKYSSRTNKLQTRMVLLMPY